MKIFIIALVAICILGAIFTANKKENSAPEGKEEKKDDTEKKEDTEKKA